MKFKTDIEIVEDYIDYYKERNFVNNLSILWQVLYKRQIQDTLSFIFYKLHVRICELVGLLKGNKKGGLTKMTFNELIDINPNIRVADLIQLFLLGKDDKIYLNLAEPKNGYIEDYILMDERIISEKWEPYYENKILWIEEEYPDEEGDLARLTLCIDWRKSKWLN